MAGLKQSKRVSWAPDVKLCQVRLFLSEDPPTQSGLGAQDTLQTKASWLLHAAVVGSDDSPPPGFEAPHAAYCLKKEISQIPLLKWQCPRRIALDPEWLVVAGEESKEVSVQNRRQLGVFEALYPRPSSIPRDPFISFEVQDRRIDDLHTPLIPITTAEEEEEEEDASQRSETAQSQQPAEPSGLPDSVPDLRFTVEHSQCSSVPELPRAEEAAAGAVPGAEPDIVAAASAAFTAIMRSSEEGSLIDRDLLIKILSNPSLIEKLVSEYEASEQTPFVAPVSAPPPPPPPPPPAINLIAPLVAPPTARIYPIPNTATSANVNRPPLLVPIVQTSMKPLDNGHPVRDMNYYKSLIQQHGEEREALDPKEGHEYHRLSGVEAGGHGSMRREAKLKILKPCVYFNSPRGCRHGASCMYQHDATLPQRDERPKGAKRIRLDRGIAGRN